VPKKKEPEKANFAAKAQEAKEELPKSQRKLRVRGEQKKKEVTMTATTSVAPESEPEQAEEVVMEEA